MPITGSPACAARPPLHLRLVPADSSSPRRRVLPATSREHNCSSSSVRQRGSGENRPVRIAVPPQGLLARAPAFAGTTAFAGSSAPPKPVSPACSLECNCISQCPRRRGSPASPPERTWSSSSVRQRGSGENRPVRVAAPPQCLLARAPALAGATAFAGSSAPPKPVSPACSLECNCISQCPRRRGSPASPPERTWSSSSPRRRGSRGDRPARLAAPPQCLLARAPVSLRFAPRRCAANPLRCGLLRLSQGRQRSPARHPRPSLCRRRARWSATAARHPRASGDPGMACCEAGVAGVDVFRLGPRDGGQPGRSCAGGGESEAMDRSQAVKLEVGVVAVSRRNPGPSTGPVAPSSAAS
jgi:hypothetical protein